MSYPYCTALPCPDLILPSLLYLHYLQSPPNSSTDYVSYLYLLACIYPFHSTPLHSIQPAIHPSSTIQHNKNTTRYPIRSSRSRSNNAINNKQHLSISLSITQPLTPYPSPSSLPSSTSPSSQIPQSKAPFSPLMRCDAMWCDVVWCVRAARERKGR